MAWGIYIALFVVIATAVVAPLVRWKKSHDRREVEYLMALYFWRENDYRKNVGANGFVSE